MLQQMRQSDDRTSPLLLSAVDVCFSCSCPAILCCASQLFLSCLRDERVSGNEVEININMMESGATE